MFKKLVNKIKILHYKWRYDAILTELYYEQYGITTEILYEDWKKLNQLQTWEQRKADLIKQGKLLNEQA